jgi:hypothetical protein
MPESQARSRNGFARVDLVAAADGPRAVDDPCKLEEAQLSPQDVLLLQACLRFVLKHQQDPGVSARLQELADTLARVRGRR